MGVYQLRKGGEEKELKEGSPNPQKNRPCEWRSSGKKKRKCLAKTSAWGKGAFEGEGNWRKNRRDRAGDSKLAEGRPGVS